MRLVSVVLALTAQFAAMNGPGWIGGDAAWSARLPDTRTVWLFGDTLLSGAPMVRNSMVVEERDGRMATLTGGTRSAPASLVPGAGPDDWYWPGPPVVGRARLEVPMAHMVRTGPGPWDFKTAGTKLAEFALPSLRLRALTSVPTPPNVNMASAAVTAGRFTYVYGTRDAWPAGKDAFVARVGAGNLRGRWAYWTGRQWSQRPAAAVAVARGVSDQFSVVRCGPHWVLVTQVPLTNRIVALVAEAPRGPWRNIGQIATIPQVPHATTYNATVHAEYSRGRTLVVGYSVGPDATNAAFGDATLYRPRFMTVRVPAAPLRGATQRTMLNFTRAAAERSPAAFRATTRRR